MSKEMKISLVCFAVIDRVVGPGGNSGRIHVPKMWVGKKVRVLLLEPIEEWPTDEEEAEQAKDVVPRTSGKGVREAT